MSAYNERKIYRRLERLLLLYYEFHEGGVVEKAIHLLGEQTISG